MNNGQYQALKEFGLEKLAADIPLMLSAGLEGGIHGGLLGMGLGATPRLVKDETNEETWSRMKRWGKNAAIANALLNAGLASQIHKFNNF